MERINVITVDKNDNIAIDMYPDTCPHCHYSVNVKHVFGYRDDIHSFLSFFCPRNDCKSYFMYRYYEYGTDTFALDVAINGKPKGVAYSQTVSDISPNFVDIYQQAEQAENIGLKDICGVGYRKALEFLIKDYIIKNDPSLKQTVENKLLAACISNHIQNQKIVDIAKRAVWVGNDETHYVRKWEGMDITHMKQLIALTVHWIETEELTKKMIAAMPDFKNP